MRGPKDGLRQGDVVIQFQQVTDIAYLAHQAATLRGTASGSSPK